MYYCSFCDYSTDNFIEYSQHSTPHYKDPNLFTTCCFCNKYQPITGFRKLHKKCRLCTYICRYRFGKTRIQYEEY